MKIDFHTICPECYTIVDQSFNRIDLIGLFERNEAMNYYCGKCDVHWMAGPEEADIIKRIL